MLHVLQQHRLSRSELQNDCTNTKNTRMRPVPYQQGSSPAGLIRRKQRSISTHIYVRPSIHPPLRWMTEWKNNRYRIIVPRCSFFSLANNHICGLLFLFEFTVWARKQASGTAVCICDTCLGVRLHNRSLLPSDCQRLLLSRIVYFRRMFEGLHYEHRHALTVVHDIEQRTISTSVRGATGALSMGPSAMYTSNLTVSMFNKVFVLLNMISMFIIVATSSSHVHIFVVTNFFLD